MFNSKEITISFIVIFFCFLGCGGGGENVYENECNPSDPNAIELYRGFVLSAAKTESQIIVKSCYSFDTVIRISWDGESPNCNREQSEDYFIGPGGGMSFEFKDHISVQICLFDPQMIIDPVTGEIYTRSKPLESCEIILTDES